MLKSTTTTKNKNENGLYVFPEVEPSTYAIKVTNLKDYPLYVSNYDAINDGYEADPGRVIGGKILSRCSRVRRILTIALSTATMLR
jgi:hypothetical protein